MTVDGPTAPGQMPPPESPSLVGQILDGRYRIVRKLGEGGMGEVYAAEHVHIEKRFAIKLLRPEIVSNPEAVTRFRQEARSSSSIGHRNIIAIEDFGQLVDGRIYMCMELLNGAALNDMITQPMGVDRLLNILIQTGHGLAAAHAKGIVHRDMKPENIFVTIGPSGEDIPKLLDFGIAKVSGNDGQNHLTRTGTIFGTPFYMAPEQALGNPVDARTDIYAVGVIMYECFSGTLPFQGDSFMGILTQHITMDPEPVAQRAAKAGRQLPGGLAEVITRCMNKNPAQRFSSMDELVNVLIQIYRGVVGPGMSTYMEAFPVPPSGAHQVQSTPVPMTGPHMIGSATPPGIPVGMMGPSGSQPVVTGASGIYPGTAPARGGKAGVIVGIAAVLAVAGGVAAFVVMSNRKDPGGTGSGSGSQVAIQDRGSSTTGHSGTSGHDGSAQGSQGKAAGTTDSGATPSAGSGSDAAQTGSAQAGSAQAGSDVANHGGSATGSNAPPAADVVPVLVVVRNASAFEVYENGTKLFDGPDSLAVPKGDKRTVVVRAAGFRDKTVVVDATKPRVQISLTRAPSTGGHTGSDTGGTTHSVPTPTGLDCSNAIVDSHNRSCIEQFCRKHPDADKCNLE